MIGTMVLPFAHPHDGRSYLFIFLSIYATLCSLYLHHVQGAEVTISYGSRFDNVTICNNFSVTAGNSSTVSAVLSSLTMIPATMVSLSPALRLIWDPGIVLAFATAIPVHMATMASLPILVHMATRVSLLMSTLLIRSTACCVNTTSPPFVCYLNRSSSCCCLAMPWLNINNTVSLVEFHPDIAPSASVFHYCHPVLSRPTVPNIDS